MDFKAREQHRWLCGLEGEWRFEGGCLPGPNGSRQAYEGREHVRRLGEFWIIAEGESNLGGTITRSLMTIGFDTFRQNYAGTWIGSMMPALWVYNGFVDPTGTFLTLESEGPSFEIEGRMTRYRDILTICDAHSRRLQSFALLANGRWREFMASEYRRES